ncbi:hypothetical protein EVAR_88003_1 [Eumeta japonica]|uniref:Uncharacterized protein n=1 Tax=Eumeta variegata TaxID=151549 RepID=A0A4C1VCR5_EUMVA|nr:hypothetical protein EVAR_88003_1 [Eumeta japonica]
MSFDSNNGTIFVCCELSIVRGEALRSVPPRLQGCGAILQTEKGLVDVVTTRGSRREIKKNTTELLALRTRGRDPVNANRSGFFNLGVRCGRRTSPSTHRLWWTSVGRGYAKLNRYPCRVDKMKNIDSDEGSVFRVALIEEIFVSLIRVNHVSIDAKPSILYFLLVHKHFPLLLVSFTTSMRVPMANFHFLTGHYIK